MDIILLSIALLLLLVGLAGCFLPVVPGPPVSFMALLLVNFTRYAAFSTEFILLTAFIAMAVTVLDFVVPVWTTKKFGGSKYGMWGAGIGIFAGVLFFPPLGLVLGPLAGAIIGEFLSGSSGKKALIAGLGSFAGFLLGIGLKLSVSLTITIYFLREIV
jgi:uncharacterized protein